jgi:ribosomal protein L28
MAQQCEICEKGSNLAWRFVKLRGKYNPTVKRRQKPNLQWVRLVLPRAGFLAGSRVKACTKCIKALAKS